MSYVKMYLKYLLKIRNKLIDLIVGKTLSDVEKPIFIVGCGHSGTTLMTSILNAHPNLYTVDHETNLFRERNTRFKIRKEIEKLNQKKEDKSKRLVEKTPKHVLRIKRILDYYPNAQIVALVRDGRDVSLSLKKRTGSFDSGVKRWINDNKALIKYVHDRRVKVIKYESLISDFDSTIDSLMTFLNENYYDSIKDYYKMGYSYGKINDIEKPKEDYNRNNHLKYRAWQANQPIYDNRGKWKEEMDYKQKIIFKKEANDILEYFDYESDNNW